MTQSIQRAGSLAAPSFSDSRSAPTTPGKRATVVDRSQVDPEIVKAAEGMEALFLDYMLKVMRKTVPKNDLDLESPATDLYRGMMDTEYANQAAHHGGIGLADQIIDYLQSRGYNQNRKHSMQEKEKP